MAVKPIDDEHHVVRHCKHRLLIRKNGRVVGVQPEHFHLRPPTPERPEQEKYLSAIYYEFFNGDHAERCRQCKAALPFQPKPKDAMTRLQSGLIKRQGASCKVQLRVTHEPTMTRPAYAAIRGLPIKADTELCSLLATLAVLEVIEIATIH